MQEKRLRYFLKHNKEGLLIKQFGYLNGYGTTNKSHMNRNDTVLTELKSAQAPVRSQFIQNTQIGVRVVHPVCVWWTFRGSPILRIGEIS